MFNTFVTIYCVEFDIAIKTSHKYKWLVNQEGQGYTVWNGHMYKYNQRKVGILSREKPVRTRLMNLIYAHSRVVSQARPFPRSADRFQYAARGGKGLET